MLAAERKQLRKIMRQRRRSTTPAFRRTAAQKLKRLVGNQLRFRQAQHVALYLSNDGEIAPEPLIDLCWALGKQVYLPVLHPIRHNRLWFIPYTPTTPMRKNRFKIPEPAQVNAPRRPAWALDLALMPLVAFDGQLNRLGMGGGFYDRTFERLNPNLPRTQSRFSGHCRLIGLAYQFQHVDALPVEAWDVPLWGIATEQQLYTG